MKEDKDLGAQSATADVTAGSIAPDAASHVAPKFTPGPWTLSPASGGGLIVGRGQYGQSLQVVPVADAHLIAAAPDLYDGCNALIGLIQLVCLRDDMPPAIKKALLCSHRMDEALAALRKAEGRSHD